MPSLVFWFLVVLLLLCTVVIVGYLYMTRNFNYWKKRGIPYVKPIPVFGNFKDVSTFQVSPAYVFKNLGDEIDAPFVGIFVFDQPVLLVKSPQFINDIINKDCSKFQNRTTFAPDHNKINSSFLFFQRDCTWKNNKAKLTKIFTPTKLKRMYGLVEEATHHFIQHVSTNSTVDLKKTGTKYTAEIIARCFYGVTSDCLNNEKSSFMDIIDRMFRFSWRNALIHSAYMFKPKLAQLLRLNFIQDSVIDLSRKIVLEMLEVRQATVEKSQDLIDILIEMKEEKCAENKNLTNEEIEEIIGIATTFLIAGIDPTSTALALTLYELSSHQDIQDKVRNQGKQIIEKYGGITYDSIQETKYLDMCIFETLRKYPTIPHICREATSSYTFAGTDITIDKGTWVYIPLYAVQMNEHKFPNANDYNPDRFRTLGKQPGELFYLPFGGGIRTCIGERLAMMVLKTAILSLLLKFKLERSSSCPEKVEFETKSFLLLPKLPLTVKFSPLKEKY